MSQKEDEAYAKWVDEVREQADSPEAIDALAGTQIGREIFRGTLGKREIDRRFNEFQREKEAFSADVQKQQSWWEKAKPTYDQAVAEAAALKRQLGSAGVASAPSAPNADYGVLTQEIESMKNTLRSMDLALPSVLTGMLQAQAEAQREGLPFEPNVVLQSSFSSKRSPLDAWRDLTTSERQAKADESFKKAIADAEERGRMSAASRGGADRAIRPAGPSVVDVLQGNAEGAAPATRQSRVDAAVRDFLEGTPS